MNNFTLLKKCNKCNELLPLNSFYFHKEASNSDGFRGTCKKDENKRRRRRWRVRYREDEEFREKKKERDRRRNNMKKNIFTKHTKEDWEFTLAFFNEQCAYCNNSLESELNVSGVQIYKNVLTEDHIIPLSQNGPYIPANIIPSCKSCNSGKKDRDLINWYKDQCFFDLYNLSIIINYLVIANERSLKENISA